MTMTFHPPFEAAVSSGSKDPAPWFLGSNRSTAGTRLSGWLAYDLKVDTRKKKRVAANTETKIIFRQDFLLTLFGNIIETLFLNGLVVDEALDFGGRAVNIRVLEQRKSQTRLTDMINIYLNV